MSTRTEIAKQNALDTLTYYFRIGVEASGDNWTESSETEVQDALLDLIRAVIEEEIGE